MTLALAMLLCSTAGVSAQQGCPQIANAEVERGWSSYRGNAMVDAERAFRSAIARCPRLSAAETGLGYVELRAGRLAAAKRWFDSVIARDARNVDALVGRGIVAWRESDVERARLAFEDVRRIEPLNQDAADYLARLPPRFAPAVRAPNVKPDTTVYPVRTNGDRFEVRDAGGWRPFYIKGMNLGAALPGRHASEFPDSATYRRWINEIAGMGVNTIRVYTIHPPAFYNALHAYNTAHPADPVWLVHGVWTELPPKNDFDNVTWKREFFAEMERVVDLLHGHSDIAPRPGHATGNYLADVSPWVLAYITGREWEPFAVTAFNKSSKRRSWSGRYFTMRAGTATDAWMAEASEHIVAYEMSRYNAQRPVAYTNWPTLDPLHHRTETTITEEVAIRRALGEKVDVLPKEYDNDSASLDPNLIVPTAALPAGWFASYHAYPYYPDFMTVDSAYSGATSSEGASNYFGYLSALKRHHADIPVVIAEYGVPASTGIAHLQPQGWYHGGLSEDQMAMIDARMTREIAEAGLAGGMLFAWIDEWFKKNWITIDYEVPADRTRMWHNGLDAEQHYGMIAMEAVPPVAGTTLAMRRSAWRSMKPLYDTAGSLRVAYDASYLWLFVEPRAGMKLDEVMIGFDVPDPAKGDTRWPGAAGTTLPVGIEFVLTARSDTVRVLVDSASNPWRIVPISGKREHDVRPLLLPARLPGMFTGAVEMRLRRPLVSNANSDGGYSGHDVVPNRRKFTRDTIEYMAIGYDRGILRHGNLPDGEWERDADGALEVRVPWGLLNFTDPSQRRVAQDSTRNLKGAQLLAQIGTMTVDGIRIVARTVATDGQESAWPASGRREDVALFSWPTWETPAYAARQRPVYDMMKATFDRLTPSVIQRN